MNHHDLGGPVVICGAGIGGLTLAYALLKRGMDVRVFEQTAELRELGAGLSLPPPAMRTLDALGLWPQVREISVRVDGICVRHWSTGETLYGKEDPDWTKKPDSPEHHGHSHRAMLHALLVREVQALAPDAIQLNHALVDIDLHANSARAVFANGVVADGALVVGADGLRSVAHAALFGARPATFTGVVALRATVPVDGLAGHLDGGRAVNFIGPGQNFLRYGIFGGSALNCVGLLRTDRWTAEGWDNQATLNEALEFFGEWHPDVVAILRHAPGGSLYKWALYDREPLPQWSRGHATLLGDAAHPMLPYLAHGATTAIEDAYVLANCLTTETGIDAALAAYEALRRPRTQEAMLASRAQGEALRHEDPHGYADRHARVARLADYDARVAQAPDKEDASR